MNDYQGHTPTNTYTRTINKGQTDMNRHTHQPDRNRHTRPTKTNKLLPTDRQTYKQLPTEITNHTNQPAYRPTTHTPTNNHTPTKPNKPTNQQTHTNKLQTHVTETIRPTSTYQPIIINHTPTKPTDEPTDQPNIKPHAPTSTRQTTSHRPATHTNHE